MTRDHDQQGDRPAAPLDVASIMRDHYHYALHGPWAGVKAPHYALAGLFKMAAEEIERLRALPSPRAAPDDYEAVREASDRLKEDATWLDAGAPFSREGGFQHANDLRLVLRALSPPMTSPAVSVPIEPTDDMMDAGERAMAETAEMMPDCPADARSCWDAMLAARPAQTIPAAGAVEP